MEMKTEREKDFEALKVLLGHWIQHNYSHNEGYHEWTAKCEKHGLDKVSDNLEKAIECFEKGTEFLVAAKAEFAIVEAEEKD